MWFIRFKQVVYNLSLPFILAVLIQGISRVFLLIFYASPDIYEQYSNDIIKMLVIGTRFDLRVASIAYAVPLLIGSILAIKERYFLSWRKLFLSFSTIITVLVGALAVVNVYYYMTYERSIDLFIFGLVDDDTKAILITLWQDYPIIRGFSIFILLNILVFYLFKGWGNKTTIKHEKKSSLVVATVSPVLIFALVFFGARGSITTFPLRQSDTQVSEVKLLNMLTPSAGLALQWAYKDYVRNSHFDVATDEEGRQILSSFFNKSVEPGLAVFKAKTPVNLPAKETPPHVVFIMMESMGEHLLSFDSPERDILGALRPHWQKDILFQRFVSEGDGTIDSLSRLLIRSPMDNISQSTAQKVDFSSNMLKPYLVNGYKVVFVTSGNGAWRNLNQFLPHLGASEFVEQSSLKKLYPEAPVSTWGIADEYMFRYIDKRLSDADANNEHLLIIALSTTHHPPYRVPDGYTQPKFSLTEQETQRLSHLANREGVLNILGTLRYTNDQLGWFIDQVKSKPLKEHTIIAVTGDHNIRGIGYSSPSEVVLGHAVPFYLYLPERYLWNSHYDPLQAGSHKDIWPTLYHLSLSETEYYQTGYSLLYPSDKKEWNFGYNPEVIIDNDGAYSNGSFRPWQDQLTGSNLLLAEPKPMTEEQSKEYARRQMITPLLKWQLNRQVHSETESKNH